MKNIFEKVLAEFRQHKIIDSVIIVLMAAMVTMIVMIVNVRNSAAATMAERSAPTISSSTTTENESIAVSSAASSSETSSAAVSSSSAPAVSQVSNSVSSSSVAVVANPAKTSSSAPKTSSAAAKPTITSGSPAPSKPTTSSAAVNNPLYAPIPIQSPQEIKTLNIAGGKLTLNLNAFAVCGYVSSKDVSQYMCDDAYFSVTENETGKVMVQGYTDEINDSNVVDISSGLDSYMHGSRAWLTSATYTVHVWCQKGQYSMNTTAGRPDKVDVCTFSFTVYERGFK